LPGTGLVAFAALAFDDTSESPSTLIIPTTVIGRRGDRAWMTRIRLMERPDDIAAPGPLAYGPTWPAPLGPGAMDPETHEGAVNRALEIIASGEAQKIVVARDVVGTIPAAADLRRLVRALADEYTDTWTFAVDGVVGASPETLVTVKSG